ncbi:MAG: S26 family signal peptidase [Spirochaetales bacterium]|nr:S26 family signal peptidase [Spirochaetales bacterium]
MIGQGGERILESETGLKIMPSGENRYIDEATLQEVEGTTYQLNRRLIDLGLYPVLEKASAALTYLEQGFPLSELAPAMIQALDACFQVASYDPLLEKNGFQLSTMSKSDLDAVSGLFKNGVPSVFNDRGYARKPFAAGSLVFVTRATDPNFFIKYKAMNRGEVSPQNYSLRKEFYQKYLGRYIPENNLLPLGDNRDNSKDGRYFGPVAVNKILGKPLLRFWPLNRFGGVE